MQYENIEGIAKEYGAKAGAAFDQGDYTGWIGNKLSGFVEAATTDPAAAATLFGESFIESLLSVNPYTAAPVILSRYAEAKNQGYIDFKSEHKGITPDASERMLIDSMAAIIATSDYVGDRLLIKLTPVLNKVLSKKPDAIPKSMQAELISKYPRAKEMLAQAGKLTGKQDLSKIDVAQVSEAGILEGTAAHLWQV
jgi:hypothetical protein